MSLILDLLVVGVVLLFIFFGFRKGFINTLIEVVGTLLAIVIAFSLSVPLSEAVYQSFVEKTVSQSVDNALAGYTGYAVEQTVNDLWQENGTIAYFAGLTGIEKEDVIAGASRSSQGGVDAVSAFVKDSVARPVATFAVRVILIALLLLILLILVKIVSKLIGKIFSFSLFGTINSVLGAVLGGVKGLLAAVVVCVLLGTVITASATGLLGFTKDSIDQSMLFGPLFGLIQLG